VCLAFCAAAVVLQVATEPMLLKQLGERLNADMSNKKDLIRKHVSGLGGSSGVPVKQSYP
jgi:hypothetical protein